MLKLPTAWHRTPHASTKVSWKASVAECLDAEDRCAQVAHRQAEQRARVGQALRHEQGGHVVHTRAQEGGDGRVVHEELPQSCVEMPAHRRQQGVECRVWGADGRAQTESNKNRRRCPPPPPLPPLAKAVRRAEACLTS